MVPDIVSLYNLALNAIGARSNLSSITERDRGAEICNLWYPVVRDQILSAANWPSCRKARRLALLATAEDETWTDAMPEPGFSFAYSFPEDMIRPRYLSGFQPFKLGVMGTGARAIMTNVEDAVLIYTFRQDIARWEYPLQMAVAYGLAANIAMPLTGKASRASVNIEQANGLVLNARVAAANSENYSIDSIPDWLSARGYANPGDERYYYPMGSLLTVGVPS